MTVSEAGQPLGKGRKYVYYRYLVENILLKILEDLVSILCQNSLLW